MGIDGGIEAADGGDSIVTAELVGLGSVGNCDSFAFQEDGAGKKVVFSIFSN